MYSSGANLRWRARARKGRAGGPIIDAPLQSSPLGAVAEQRSERSDESRENPELRLASLDVLIDYRRREVDTCQAQIDQAETQAAGLIAGALTVGLLSITLLKSLGTELPGGAIALSGLGGVCLIVGIIIGFLARDPRTTMSWWFDKFVHGRWRSFTEGLLKKRRTLACEGPETSKALSPDDHLRLREQMSGSLAKRVAAAEYLRQWKDGEVRRSALLIVGGTALLLAAGVWAALGG